jgi:putative transposase
MRGPKPSPIELTAPEQQALEALIRRHSTPHQQVLRARIVLAAAAGLNNAQIARQYAVSLEMVRLWRARWRSLQGHTLADLPLEKRLTDEARAGRPAQITAEQVCQIVALACEAPSLSQRPISQWTGREIAAEIIQRGILPTISPRHAARILKKKISSRIGCATG